jgi:hypothetical protein
MQKTPAARKPVFIGKPDPTMIRLAWAQTDMAPPKP